MVKPIWTDSNRSLSFRWHTWNCRGTSTWKEVRIKAEPSNVAHRACAREKQIQKQLLFKLTKKWASLMFKYHFTIAATVGGTFHMKIRFAKHERIWPPSNRPQSVVLARVESSAQRRQQIPCPRAARAVPTPLLGEPRPDSARCWLTPLGADVKRPQGAGNSLKTRFLLALDTPNRTGREKEGNYWRLCVHSALELHMNIQDSWRTSSSHESHLHWSLHSCTVQWNSGTLASKSLPGEVFGYG